jgi:hypothetical protein
MFLYREGKTVVMNHLVDCQIFNGNHAETVNDGTGLLR